jgi:hypothetical protein
VPASVKVYCQDCPWVIVGEWMATGALVVVTSCGAWSVFVQVTVSPTRTVRAAGEKAYWAIVTDSVAAEAAAEAGAPTVTGTSAAIAVASNPAAIRVTCIG